MEELNEKYKNSDEEYIDALADLEADLSSLKEEVDNGNKDDRHIPLIEPIKEKREFESPNDFDKYYQEHKKELEEKTTHKLNKMFNIPGYRITKIKGVLSLKNIPQSRITSTMKIDSLELKVNEMKDRLNQCINTINNVLDFINSFNQSQQRY